MCQSFPSCFLCTRKNEKGSKSTDGLCCVSHSSRSSVRPAGRAGARTSLSCWSGVSLIMDTGYKFSSFLIWCLLICLQNTCWGRTNSVCVSLKHHSKRGSILQTGIFISIKRLAYDWTPVSDQERLPHWASRTLFILTVFWGETINSFIWWSSTRVEV